MKQEYKGWLISDNIVKRILALWGHLILGYIFVLIIIIPITLLLTFLV